MAWPLWLIQTSHLFISISHRQYYANQLFPTYALLLFAASTLCHWALKLFNLLPLRYYFCISSPKLFIFIYSFLHYLLSSFYYYSQATALKVYHAYRYQKGGDTDDEKTSLWSS